MRVAVRSRALPAAILMVLLLGGCPSSRLGLCPSDEMDLRCAEGPCCEATADSASQVAASCDFLCPTGQSLLTECTPDPSCMDPCPGDAPALECRGGPCCEELESAMRNPETCEPVCREGFAFECTPEPSCGCGDGPMPAPPECFSGPCCEESDAPIYVDEECDFVCPTGSSEFCVPDAICDEPTPCASPTDCVLTPSTCCEECEDPTLEDFIAVHRDDRAAVVDSMCRGMGSCEACTDGLNTALIATCQDDECIAVDVRVDELTSCTRNEQCVLRSSGCCICEDGEPVAIRRGEDEAFESLVCDGSESCDGECAPLYMDFVAVCEAEHCLAFPVE